VNVSSLLESKWVCAVTKKKAKVTFAGRVAARNIEQDEDTSELPDNDEDASSAGK
jgi:hypothetical protein